MGGSEKNRDHPAGQRREQRLAKALRANLRRRKAAKKTPPSAPTS